MKNKRNDTKRMEQTNHRRKGKKLPWVVGPVDTHSIFVIDKNGTIQWGEISPHKMYVPLDSILEELMKL
jgi:hypothetical protein